MPFGLHRLFRRRQAPWWMLVAGLAVTAALGWKLHRSAVEMDRQRLEKSEMLLQNLRDYLMLSGENRNQVFARWCYENGLSINCPWLYGIAVATNPNEAHWKSQLPNPPETWTAADWETFRQLARRHVIDCEIALTSETKDGQQFLDDYGFQRLLRDQDPFAMAAKESRVSMSEQRWVMMDANGNRLRGTLYHAPIYKPEVADLLGDEASTKRTNTWFRWMLLTSVILAPVDFKALAQSVWGGVPADLGMELFSLTNQTATNWLNSSEGAPHAADPKFQAYLTHCQPWPMYGKRFSIFFYTTPLFEAQSPRRLA
jgi:hypothetical protein